MKTIRVSATVARNNFFSLLNQVFFGNVRVIIKKEDIGREAVLSSGESKEKEAADRMRVLDKTFGVFKHSPLSNFIDDRIRGKRAKEHLKRLRRGDV